MRDRDTKLQEPHHLVGIHLFCNGELEIGNQSMVPLLLVRKVRHMSFSIGDDLHRRGFAGQ